MDLTIQIPDALGDRLAAEGRDLVRRALEGFALAEFKSRRITKAEMRGPLGFETRYELDGFLKAHQVYDEHTLEDFERERDALKSLGF